MLKERIKTDVTVSSVGDINVCKRTEIYDDETGEVKANNVWRCAIGAGDTTLANEILGEKAEAAMALAGTTHENGWDGLVSDRQAKIAEAKS